MTDRFINPFTDFGFKRIFGEESNKDLLIDFLGELLQDEGKIVSLTYLKNEHLGGSKEDRKAIFDLYCENERGEKFIVELQKAKQKFFKDRSLYYATFPIQEQAQTGEWNFKLQKVYTIAIMDFVFDESPQNAQKFIHNVWLMERETGTIFYDKLRFVFLEMPKFNKSESELATHFDKWLFVLKNLSKMRDIPPVHLQEQIFQKLFHIAEVAQYSFEERQAYQNSLKYYRDIKNITDTALEEGVKQGIEKGIQQGIEKGIQQGIEKGISLGIIESQKEIALRMLGLNLPLEQIAAITSLSIADIQAIQNEQKS